MGARGPGARPPRSPEAKRKQVYNARQALRRAEAAAAGVTDLRRFRRLRRFFLECELDDLTVEAALAAVPGATPREAIAAMHAVADELEDPQR
jgi:hypothetical protein